MCPFVCVFIGKEIDPSGVFRIPKLVLLVILAQIVDEAYRLFFETEPFSDRQRLQPLQIVCKYALVNLFVEVYASMLKIGFESIFKRETNQKEKGLDKSGFSRANCCGAVHQGHCIRETIFWLLGTLGHLRFRSVARSSIPISLEGASVVKEVTSPLHAHYGVGSLSPEFHHPLLTLQKVQKRESSAFRFLDRLSPYVLAPIQSQLSSVF